MISKELFERCIADIGIDLPENAFFMVGTFEDAVKKAKTL